MLTEGMGTVRSGQLCVYRDVTGGGKLDLVYARDLSADEGECFAAAAYDARFRELAATGDFRPLAELVEAAKADSLWQLLVLQGATGGRPLELLAYDAPTYYGMAVAIAT